MKSGSCLRKVDAVLVAWLVGAGAVQADPRQQPDPQEAALERALSLQERSIGNRAFALVPTLERLSDLHYDAGRWADCERLDRRILDLRLSEQGEDHVDVAVARKNLALDLYRLGRFAEEEALLRSAAASLSRLHSPPTEKLADALGYLAESLRAQGRYREAEPLFLRALALGPTSRSTLLSNLGGFYRDQNRYAEALWRLSQALRLEESREKPSRAELVSLWNNIAELYRFQGDTREAERFYGKAVAAAREVFGPDHSRLGTMLNQLAELYREQGRLLQAEPLYREALAVKTRALGANHPDLAHTHEGLGRLLASAGRPREAEVELREALEIRITRLGTSHPDAAMAKIALAELLATQPGREVETGTWLDSAVVDLESSASAGRSRARALSLRAGLRRARGDRIEARRDLSRSLELVERLRPEAGGGEQTRARFAALHAADYARLAGWLVEDGDVDAAFVTVERARGRALLDQLAAAHADLLDGVAPDERAALQKREADLLSRLAADRERLSRLDAEPATGTGPVSERGALEGRIAVAQVEYERLYEDIRNASLQWRGFASNREPAGVTTTQERVVPRGGLLLSYLIDERQVLLFVVPPAGAPAAVLRLSVPETAARELGVEPGPLDARKLRRILAPETLDPNAADGLLARLGRAPTGGRARPALARALNELFRVLVPDALWPRLVASREVVIVPDQLLHRLPFEALVVSQGADGPRFWLDDGPAVRYAPSATTLVALTERPRSATRGLVSVADPAYGRADDGRLPGGSGLERLPGTAREAAAIRAAFATQGLAGAVTSLEGADAREPRVRSLLPTGRYLHLATHGMVDDSRGELFATLALTPPPADATPDDDGLLQLHEILRLHLDAELAVLSACESRVGEIVAGEGVFALSRAFLIAGSRRVVATLWPAADEATAGLVAGLFAGIAGSEASHAPIDYAANLVHAKRQVRAQPTFSDPFFWAPFVLEGAR